MPLNALGAAAVRAATLALLARRAAGATVCPSEVARAMAAARGGADWRAWMPDVHAEIDRMAAQGLVQLSWRAASRCVADGPYRIGLPPAPAVDAGSSPE